MPRSTECSGISFLSLDETFFDLLCIYYEDLHEMFAENQNYLHMAISLEYVTVDDIDFVMTEQQQAEATDDVSGPNDTATKDTDKITKALKFAESTVESYLIGYELPISPVPFSLQYAVLNIGKYYLLKRDGRVSEDEQTNYDDAIAWLQDVRDGDARLPDVDEDPDEFVGKVNPENFEFYEMPFTDYDYYSTGL